MPLFPHPSGCPGVARLCLHQPCSGSPEKFKGREAGGRGRAQRQGWVGRLEKDSDS